MIRVLLIIAYILITVSCAKHSGGNTSIQIGNDSVRSYHDSLFHYQDLRRSRPVDELLLAKEEVLRENEFFEEYLFDHEQGEKNAIWAVFQDSTLPPPYRFGITHCKDKNGELIGSWLTVQSGDSDERRVYAYVVHSNAFGNFITSSIQIGEPIEFGYARKSMFSSPTSSGLVLGTFEGDRVKEFIFIQTDVRYFLFDERFEMIIEELL
ncbi:MAG: hypothetical protein HWD92_04670 [Flavobacteriia bacterium]|nr:hypothetical protein [Flavobacteriia bacterium]